jgi:cysteinyl-tRNA synthetase
LSDDLNTPKAIAELHQLRNAAVHGKGVSFVIDLIQSLRALGFIKQTAAEWNLAKQPLLNVDKGKIDNLIVARNVARAKKDFKESDRIRDELAAMGVVLKDSKDGTTWELAR